MAHERPLPLITLDKNQRFVVGEEAFRMISSLEGDIAVVSVAGLYRTGKSYILNRLLGRQEAFEIGPTVNPCTKGIYTWGKPIIREINGRKVNIVLVDTEGIGSVQQDQTYDAKIFSLAILLSSYFIYNSMGVIDERALDQLSLVVQLTKHIAIKSEKDNVSLSEYANYFPNFLWLLRDFSLELVDENNNVITPTEYLENALRELPGAHQNSKNEIRRCIKNFFPRRDCYTLVRPVVDERDLRKLDKLNWNNMRPEFQQQVNNLVKKVFAEITPKQIHGKNVNGRAYGAMIKAYVDAINRGAVPNISNAWNSVANIENQRAVEQCFQMYRTKLARDVQGKLPMDEAMLLKISDTSKSEALAEFQVHAFGEYGAYAKKLIEHIDQEFKRYCDMNRMESSKQCQQLLAQLFAPLRHKSQKNEWKSAQEIVEAWSKFHQDYLNSARGPADTVVRALVEFEVNGFGSIWLAYMTHLSAQAQEKLEEQRKKEEAQAKRMEQLMAEAHKSEVSLVREREKAQHLEANLKRLEASLNQVTKEREDLSNKLKTAQEQCMQMTTQMHSQDADKKVLTEKLELITRERQRLEQELIRLTATHETAQMKINGLEKERDKLQEQLKQSQVKINGLEKEHQKLQEQLKQSQLELTKQRGMLAKSEEELAKLRSDAESQRAELSHVVDAEKGKTEKLEMELNKLRKELESTIERAKMELNKLRKELDSANLEKQREKSNTEKLEKELNRLREELKNVYAEKEKAKDVAEALEQTLDNLRTGLKSVDEEKVNAKEESVAQEKISEDESSVCNAEEQVDQQPKTTATKRRIVRRGRKSSVAPAVVEIETEEVSGNKENEDSDGETSSSRTAKRTAKGTAAKKTSSRRRTKVEDEMDIDEPAPRAKRKRGDIDETEMDQPPSKRPNIDPNKLTKTELKQILTSHNVKLPPTDQVKRVYVDLYLSHVAE